MLKITSIMRQMKNDREFCEAVFQLIDAQDKLREIQNLKKINQAGRRNTYSDLVKGGRGNA